MTRVMLFVFALAATTPAFASNSHSYSSDSRPEASSTSGNFGAGVMLGEPTGLSAKYWLSHVNALDFGLTYSFNHYFGILTDYLWHFPNAFASSGRTATQFVPYLGVGLAFFFNAYDGPHGAYYGYGDSSVTAGMRIPLGMEFLPRKVPLGVFLEIVPGVGLIPGMFGFIQGDLGIRFYF